MVGDANTTIIKVDNIEDEQQKEAKPTTKNHSRKNMGRNARRRRQKVLAIEAAAAQAAIGNTPALDCESSIEPGADIGNPSCILPQDRGYQWPAVKDLCLLSESDKHQLIAQLGYLPGNALQVVARVKDYFPSLCNIADEPLALKLYPLVLRDESDSTRSHRKRRRPQTQEGEDVTTIRDKTNNDINDNESREKKKKKKKDPPLVEPFPTMYWVTHPRFRALISKLELISTATAEEGGGGSGGSIKQFQDRLQKESEALASMKRAHLQYGQERFDLITQDDWKFIQNRQWEAAFSPSRGVAGIRKPSGIKCLHSHAAHYWSGCRDNVVGQWTSDQVKTLLDEADQP
ncbi:unnamed protein product [Cylindrotheca closterium]|uniref:Uncharacterized protein n=1 Tax=Cylindrotheca closterium TaxID=2856 RepID=A0AAD2PVL0_9STRA|nr:unnamed protein product [Cylindrotheca closterium]